MRVNEAFRFFIEHGRVERRYAPETQTKHTDCFRVWILPHLGERELSAITYADITNLRARMLERRLSVAREYQIVMTLKLFLKFVRAVLHLACIDPGQVKLPPRRAPDVQYLTNEEVMRLVNAIPLNTFTGSRLRALVELLLSTGMRISEALSVNRDWVDRHEHDTEIIGKGGRRRKVFVTPRAMYWLGRYLAARYDRQPELFVTTGEPPRRLKRADISKMFVRLRRDAQLTKRVTPHMLRHTFCTNLLFNGTDIRFIRDLAGHQDIATTSKYYLGKDDRVLRRVVETQLDYSVPNAKSPVSQSPETD